MTSKQGPTDGMLIGVANAAIVAIGMSALDPHNRLQMATVVFLFGSLPAILTGVALGRLGDAIAHQPVWLRRVWLVVPAWIVVAMLGALTGMTDLVLVSCIPTTAAALLLERRTRARPIGPVAVMRR